MKEARRENQHRMAPSRLAIDSKANTARCLGTTVLLAPWLEFVLNRESDSCCTGCDTQGPLGIPWDRQIDLILLRPLLHPSFLSLNVFLVPDFSRYPFLQDVSLHNCPGCHCNAHLEWEDCMFPIFLFTFLQVQNLTNLCFILLGLALC